MTATLQPPPQAHEPRNMLHGISWETYERLVSEVGERPALQMTYDQGSLEICETSSAHAIARKQVGRLIPMMCFQLSIPYKCGGSFTHKRADLLKGIEPDECYWIANEFAVRGKIQIDPSIDPPPDLALEVDITRSWLDRIAIYAALGIPEVWCFDGKVLRVHLLQSNGEYAESETSAAFPFLPIDDFAGFLQFDEETDELTRMKGFVEWLGEQGFQHDASGR